MQNKLWNQAVRMRKEKMEPSLNGVSRLFCHLISLTPTFLLQTDSSTGFEAPRIQHWAPQPLDLSQQWILFSKAGQGGLRSKGTFLKSKTSLPFQKKVAPCFPPTLWKRKGSPTSSWRAVISKGGCRYGATGNDLLWELCLYHEISCLLLHQPHD